MRHTEGRLRFAPTDLAAFLACRHLTERSRKVALGELRRPRRFDDPRLDALREAGRAHEQQALEELARRGRSIWKVIREDQGAARTLEAMRAGVEVIYQGELSREDWSGLPDFLLRVSRPSRFGDWSYEVSDAKLAQIAKADAVLQITVYSWLLGEAQGVVPERMHLELPGGKESFRVADFAAFERAIRRRLEIHSASPGETYPEPVSRCDWCDWKKTCQDRRRKDDHLSLVAGATRHQRRRLEGRDISTLTGLAQLDLPLTPRLEGVRPVTLEKIHRQAAIQLEGRGKDDPHFELREAEGGLGLLALPEPSPGDLFFDIESSRVIAGSSLEYLFGLLDRDDSYRPRWALDVGEERRVFERFMDTVAERRARDADLHIYHYGPYETGALKRLMSRYATCEEEMDDLLRRGVFVDLLQIVRQGIVAAVENYSLKDMEPFHGFVRQQDLVEAIRARIRMDVVLERGEVTGSEDRGIIERYNREDCLSTRSLQAWLEKRRQDLVARIGPKPRPTVDVDPRKEKERSEKALAVAELAQRVGVPDPEDPARRLLGWLLDYYRREDKSALWDYFHRLGMDAEDLLEDRSALAGLEFRGKIGQEAKSGLYEYRYPSQEHDIRVGDTPKGFRIGDAADDAKGAGTVTEISEDRLVLKRGATVAARPQPAALIKKGVIPNPTLRDSLFRLGESVATDGFADASPRRAAYDLLHRIPPRSSGAGNPLRRDGEKPVPAARRLALSLDREVLAVQGPPGSGKTYLGARVVTALLAEGRRVGVTAQSHRVITNLLDAVVKAADEERVPFRGLQVWKEGKGCEDARIKVVAGSGSAEVAADGVQLIAGTAWVWTREGMRDSVDTLVVDEAGQFSLANTLGCAQATRNLVLLGDPRQLDQVTQGIHPEGADASALGHLLGDEKTISPDRGLLLPETWRMHPDICRFTSELFYEELLTSRPGLECQTIEGGPLPGAGLRFVPVKHDGNQRESPEEAQRIEGLIAALVAEAMWTDQNGVTRRVTPRDVLIVAPYNAQVDLLKRTLGDRARVGTVDKFQGQEAPVVFYSMATSTPDAAPRGMDFLYSLNRLNVATSRARCLAVVVASPELFLPECKSPQQMRLANAFCRLSELAEVVE